MRVQKKFLVLVDGSERTMQAVTYGKDSMPVDEDTRIVLFHVFSGIPEECRELAKDPTCADALHLLKGRGKKEERLLGAYLEQAKETLISFGVPEPSIEIKLQPLKTEVAGDIIDEAQKGYTAVVMRRRGRGALRNVILGSMAVKLLQSLTEIPLIMVGEAHPVKKVLLAVDSSPSSMKAVEFVCSLLGGHGYEVCVFHAIPGLGAVDFELPEGDVREPPEVETPDACIEAYRLKVAAMLRDIKGRLMASGFERERISKKIVSGVYSRAQAIITEAEEGGYSSIVVGRRGLSRVNAFFMGRVGHEVVYNAKKFTVWVIP